MADIDIWASGAGAVIQEPTDAKKETGFVACEQNTVGEWNWLFNEITSCLNQLNSRVEVDTRLTNMRRDGNNIAFDVVDIDGNIIGTESFPASDLINVLETVTNVVKNNDGSVSYVNEDGDTQEVVPNLVSDVDVDGNFGCLQTTFCDGSIKDHVMRQRSVFITVPDSAMMPVTASTPIGTVLGEGFITATLANCQVPAILFETHSLSADTFNEISGGTVAIGSFFSLDGGATWRAFLDGGTDIFQYSNVSGRSSNDRTILSEFEFNNARPVDVPAGDVTFGVRMVLTSNTMTNPNTVVDTNAMTMQVMGFSWT